LSISPEPIIVPVGFRSEYEDGPTHHNAIPLSFRKGSWAGLLT